jgi:hypothetical protein
VFLLLAGAFQLLDRVAHALHRGCYHSDEDTDDGKDHHQLNELETKSTMMAR